MSNGRKQGVTYSKPITELVKARFSCRRYREKPISEAEQRQLTEFIAANSTGPLASPARFELVAATEEDRRALRGLSTYGFIRNPTGFIIGAMEEAEHNLEDFGYAMERIILFATGVGLGTCWLGGTFAKSRFAQKIGLKNGESVPAVTSIGYVAGEPRDDLIHRWGGGAHRYAWDTLFFDRRFDAPLSPEAAGRYAVPLEMVRLGPSASNKQPWRIIRDGNVYHFYVQRTPGYRESIAFKLLGIADMQRLDMGIAMCHLELTARELGLQGRWEVDEPTIEKPDEMTEYTASWVQSNEE
jgi:nitroreductase